MIVLEELDSHKKGMTEVARNGRQASRTLDALVATQEANLAQGIHLNATGQKGATAACSYPRKKRAAQLPPARKPAPGQGRQPDPGRGGAGVQGHQHARQGACAGPGCRGLPERQDAGRRRHAVHRHAAAAAGFLGARGQEGRELAIRPGHLLPHQRRHHAATAHQPVCVLRSAGRSQPVCPRDRDPRQNRGARDTEGLRSPKNNVWGVTTRNREQNFAMNLLMDPDVDFVTLAGTAGTGRPWMRWPWLNQVLDERRYTEIIMTRATVSVGEDIGFLPGTEEEKMRTREMGALDDNLEFLAKGDGGNPGEWGRSATNDLIRSRIKIKSMNFHARAHVLEQVTSSRRRRKLNTQGR
ncbi:hypothetical protein FQA39_LY19379 [Lamprigera yunnana]|nr:hypothetical protein FQA39_LY19379 [Lamprigera yunnana]